MFVPAKDWFSFFRFVLQYSACFYPLSMLIRRFSVFFVFSNCPPPSLNPTPLSLCPLSSGDARGDFSQYASGGDQRPFSAPASNPRRNEHFPLPPFHSPSLSPNLHSLLTTSAPFYRYLFFKIFPRFDPSPPFLFSRRPCSALSCCG